MKQSCIIVLKSGHRIKIADVSWSKLVNAVNQSIKSGASNTFLIWDDFLLNIGEVAAIFLEGKGVENG